MDDLYVGGLQELHKFLQTLPVKVETNIMRGALRAGAKVIEARAKAEAPVGEPSKEGRIKYNLYRGALRDSVRVTTQRRGRWVRARVRAGGRNRKTGADVWYAHLVEFTGTKKHRIKTRNANGLSIGGKGVFFKYVDHPGMPKNPFMRRAFDAESRNAIKVTANYIKRRLSTKHGLNSPDILSIGGA